MVEDRFRAMQWPVYSVYRPGKLIKYVMGWAMSTAKLNVQGWRVM